MKLNLKTNGAIAKYLGRCFYQDTYHPASFCSLFWALTCSPFIFAGCSVMAGGNYLVEKYDTAVENSRKRKARALVEIYLADPKEALFDFKDHFYPGPTRVTLRHWRIVDMAFTMLGKHFGDSDMRRDQVLEKLGLIKTYDDIVKAESRPEQKKPVISSLSFKDLMVYILENYGILLLVAVIPLIISLIFAPVFPELLFTMTPTVLIIGLLVTLFVRLELNVVTANLYRAVKTKTCPIIKWEE